MIMAAAMVTRKNDGGGHEVVMTSHEFLRFRELSRELLGIDFGPHKQSLICGRLAKRLRHFGFTSYSQYLELVMGKDGHAEMQTMIDLLTTHETYFFREPAHFDYLADEVLAYWPKNRPLAVWSAASSTGEEPYTLAMTMMDCLGDAHRWTLFASDISRDVLDTARKGVYPMARGKGIPEQYLKRYCMRGIGAADGYFKIDKTIRDKVTFDVVNLNESLAGLPEFDIIFLRNVLIYFDLETKARVIARIAGQLKANGLLFIGHSESLNGINCGLSPVRPTIYRRFSL